MRFSSSILLAGLLWFATAQSGPAQGTPPMRDHQQFRSALAPVRQGLTESEVTALIGWLDDIRTERGPGGVPRLHIREVWGGGRSRRRVKTE